MSRITEGWRIHFFVFLSFFFRVCFLLVFWKVLEGSFGARRARFRSILETFSLQFCSQINFEIVECFKGAPMGTKKNIIFPE